MNKPIVSVHRYNSGHITALMQSRGIIEDDESVSDVFNRVVQTLLAMDASLEQGVLDTDFIQKACAYTEDKTFAFGTPILTNTGRFARTTTGCTVLTLPVINNRLNISKFKRESLRMLRSAVGTGYDLSELEDPAGALVEMNTILNKVNTSFIKKHKRPVACMATLRANHPQIFEFLRIKNSVNFSNWRFNISIFVIEKLFQNALHNEKWELKTADGRITRVLPAKELLYEIARSAHFCGEPGILFKDRFDAGNPTPYWEYTSTDPCAVNAMAAGEACQFSYINLTEMYIQQGENKIFDFEKFHDAVAVMTRLLDASLQITIENDAYKRERIPAKRRIGVSVTGFAALLMNIGIPYDSNAAVMLAKQISETLDFASKTESVNLAKKRGPFPVIHKSRYTDSEWVRRKQIHRTGIISAADWENLYKNIEKFGIRHASTTAYPPTGTSSRIVETTTSFEPAYELVQWTKTGDQKEPVPILYDFVEKSIHKKFNGSLQINISELLAKNNYVLPQPWLEKLGREFATARQIDHSVHIKITSAFQKFADESVSKTINMPNHSSVDDVLEALMTAYHSGLKGISIFRENCLAERS